MLCIINYLNCGLLLTAIACSTIAIANTEKPIADQTLSNSQDAINTANEIYMSKLNPQDNKNITTATQRNPGQQIEFEQSASALDTALEQFDTIKLSEEISKLNTRKMNTDIEKLFDQFSSPLPNMSSTANRSNTLLIFVSKSLPDASLHQLAIQAKQAEVPLIFRGFVGDSMRSTLAYFQELISATNNTDKGQTSGNVTLSLMIDPLLFERFDVSQVPAFTVIRHGQHCIGPTARCNKKTPEHKTVYGNVSLGYAVDALSRLAPSFSSDLAPISEKLKIHF